MPGRRRLWTWCLTFPDLVEEGLDPLSRPGNGLWWDAGVGKPGPTGCYCHSSWWKAHKKLYLHRSQCCSTFIHAFFNPRVIPSLGFIIKGQWTVSCLSATQHSAFVWFPIKEDTMIRRTEQYILWLKVFSINLPFSPPISTLIQTISKWQEDLISRNTCIWETSLSIWV